MHIQGTRKYRWIGILAALMVSLVALPVAARPASASTCLLTVWSKSGRFPWRAVTLSGVPPACGASAAMVRSPLGTEVATVGIDGSIWFYWNIDGSKVWQSEQVIGPGWASGNPAMVRVGNGTMIAAYSPFARAILYYWATDGSGSWTYCGGTGTALPNPAMAASSTAAVVPILLTNYHLEWDEEYANCTGGMDAPIYVNGQQPTFDLAPAITLSSSGTEIAADFFGSLSFLWSFNSSPGTWYSAPVGNAVANAATPAMTRFSDGTSIVSTGYDGSLWFYWNVDGTPAWNSSQIAAAGSANLSPAIARFTNGTDVAATRGDGSLWLYSNIDGTPPWSTSEIAGPLAVTGSPAIVLSSTTTEIAAVT